MDIAQEMLKAFNDDPDLLTNHGCVAQSSQWTSPKEPRPKKALQVFSHVKVLLPVFFDCNGVVYHEFLSQGRAVKKKYYLEVRHRLHT